MHDVSGLTDRVLGSVTGVSASNVRNWLSGRSEPTGDRRERMIELAEMVRQLGTVMQADAIAVWLQRPIERPHNQRPFDLSVTNGGPSR